jgi:RNA polymerase sigma factor (sigma-70 family)
MLLQLVMKRSEAFAPAADGDAALVKRFAETRDEAAFADLLQRHGPMVWSVCRNLLPDDAETEDAFQAVFLALVRSAKSVRNPEAVGAWLHGVAVRIATRVKRGAARRRQREERAAGPEADRPVPEAAWNELLAAVHEEVLRLPDSLRTVFVMCELEGVRQPDAAARLGWKPGTLTGRLTRARQLVVERLTNRGLAPALAGGGLALGQATATAAVPGPLIESALNLVRAGGTIPAAVLNLAKGASPMMAMRAKMLAFSVVFAGGLGAVLFPMATAQPPGGGGGQPSLPGGTPKKGSGAFNPLGGGGSGASMGPGGGVVMLPLREQWEYKFSPSAKDNAKLFADLGNEGWQYCGPMPSEVIAGNTMQAGMLVFKRSKNPPLPSGATSGVHGGGSGFGAPPGGGVFGASPPGALTPPSGGGSSAGPMVGSFGGESPSVTPAAPAQTLVIIPVKNGIATELSAVLERVFKGSATISAESRTNSLIIRANEATHSEVKSLVDKLDTAAKP